MRRGRRLLITAAAVFLCLGWIAPGAVQASEWAWSLTPYFWGSDLQLSVQVNDQQVIDRRVGLSDLIDKLDFIFAGRLEARRHKFGLFGDVYFADFGGDDRDFDLASPPGQLVAKGDLEFMIVEAGGLYNLTGTGEGLSLLLGTRVFAIDQSIDVRYEFEDGSVDRRNYDTSSTLWDVLVGARYIGRFAERWMWDVKADASAAGTDLTWTAMAGVGWLYGKERQHAILVGYRYMDIDFDEPTDRQQDIDSEIEMAGFFGAFKFGF
jgi:hypothetical protein